VVRFKPLQVRGSALFDPPIEVRRETYRKLTVQRRHHRRRYSDPARRRRKRMGTAKAPAKLNRTA
jgi:hypothetical protein